MRCSCSTARHHAPVCPSTPDQRRWQTALAGSVGVVGTAQPALADGLLPSIEGVDQVVVGVGFTVAVALLTVVTAGVRRCGLSTL